MVQNQTQVVGLRQMSLLAALVARQVLNVLKPELDMATKNLSDLTAQIAANTSAEQSALTLIQGFQARQDAAIAANADGDDAALPALSADLAASAAPLAAAVVANTPVAAPGSVAAAS